MWCRTLDIRSVLVGALAATLLMVLLGQVEPDGPDRVNRFEHRIGFQGQTLVISVLDTETGTVHWAWAAEALGERVGQGRTARVGRNGGLWFADPVADPGGYVGPAYQAP